MSNNWKLWSWVLPHTLGNARTIWQNCGYSDERWSQAYRYLVANVVRQVKTCLSRHVPSYLIIAGQRVFLSYEGQPATRYGCGERGRMYQGCHARQKPGPATTTTLVATYADIVTDSAAMTKDPSHDIMNGNGSSDDEGARSSTVLDWSSNRDETGNSVAQVVTPTHLKPVPKRLRQMGQTSQSPKPHNAQP
jgi:hypothetical protein